MSDVRPRDGGMYSLYCCTCGSWVPDTASEEMRREGYFAHSHLCEMSDEESMSAENWLKGWFDEEAETDR